MCSQTATSIHLITGRYFDLIDPDPEDFKAWDIAWSLHSTNRYNGHTTTPWDVLSHTGLCYLLAMMENNAKISWHNKLGILLHDAAEAYCGDMVRPLKQVMPEFERVETNIMNALLTRLGVEFGDINWDFVKEYDNQALRVEVAKLQKRTGPSRYTPVVKNEPNYKGNLILTKIPDYLNALRDTLINLKVERINEFFECPEYLLKEASFCNTPFNIQNDYQAQSRFNVDIEEKPPINDMSKREIIEDINSLRTEQADFSNVLNMRA